MMRMDQLKKLMKMPASMKIMDLLLLPDLQLSSLLQCLQTTKSDHHHNVL